MQIRLPLACLLIISYCFLYYSRKRRLPTRASKIFLIMGGVTIVNLLAATVTEYTVNNRGVIPEMFNYAWHVLFLTTLTLWCGLFLAYVILIIERDGGGSHRMGKIVITMLCSAVICLQIFLPIEYIDTANGSYSLGAKAYALYVVVAYMLAALPYYAIKYRKVLGARRSNVFVTSSVIYVAIALIQMIWPFLLLTSIAATMIMLGLMISTEDANLYISNKTGLYNHYAFQKVSQEKLNDHKPLEVEIYFFSGSDKLAEKSMVELSQRLHEMDPKLLCCMIHHNTLAIVPRHEWGKESELPGDLSSLMPEEVSSRCMFTEFCFPEGTSFEHVDSTIRSARKMFESKDVKIDELTQMLRRDAFIEQVDEMLARRDEFILLMIDIDDFKDINDTFGHGVGDEVLQGVSMVFRGAIRGTDIACRMGGDEFAILLAGTSDKASALAVHERILEGLSLLRALPDNENVISTSIGARIYVPDEGDTDFKTLYDHADKAMYEVKNSGKNGLVFYEQNPSEDNPSIAALSE